MLRAIPVCKEFGYDGMLMPEHAPAFPATSAAASPSLSGTYWLLSKPLAMHK